MNGKSDKWRSGTNFKKYYGNSGFWNNISKKNKSTKRSASTTSKRVKA